VRLDDPMKSKHLKRALEQLAEEGVTRVFKPLTGGDWIVGVVGALQLDVLAARIKTEYDLGVRFEQGAFETARWLSGPAEEIKRFEDSHRSLMAEDHDGVKVFMARNAWDLDRMTKDWPALTFNATREQTAEETV
jgi:peptide chain release factor 3